MNKHRKKRLLQDHLEHIQQAKRSYFCNCYKYKTVHQEIFWPATYEEKITKMIKPFDTTPEEPVRLDEKQLRRQTFEKKKLSKKSRSGRYHAHAHSWERKVRPRHSLNTRCETIIVNTATLSIGEPFEQYLAEHISLQVADKTISVASFNTTFTEAKLKKIA